MTGDGSATRLTAPAASAPPAIKLGPPALSSAASSPSQYSPHRVSDKTVDVGGELRIKIDSDGRARVTSAKSNGGMAFNVESGPLGVVP